MFQTFKNMRSKSLEERVSISSRSSQEKESSRGSRGPSISSEPRTAEIAVPLLFDSITQKTHQAKYYIEKYDPSCIEESKIESIQCLLFDEKKIFFNILFSIISLSIINIISWLYPKVKVKLQFLPSNISKCTHFLIHCKDQKFYIIKAYEINLPQLGSNSVILNHTKLPIYAYKTKAFEFKLHRYAYCQINRNFVSVKFNFDTNFDIIRRKMSIGLTEQEVKFQKILYEYKKLSVHKVKSVYKLLFLEVKNPFYLIQLLCILYWFKFGYSYFALILLIASILTLSVSIYEIKQNFSLVDKISNYSCEITVQRIVSGNKKVFKINSKDLVPGDIFLLSEKDKELVLPFDGLLLTGNVVLDESFLTGESIPIFKTHIPNSNEHCDKRADKRFILFSGTKVLQARDNTTGIVIGTKFDTEKGDLIRAILFKVDENFKKNETREIWKIIIFSLSFWFICEIFFFYFMRANGSNYSLVIWKSFDLLSSSMTPAIPVCVVIGTMLCLVRIKKKGINCVDKNKINIIGKVNLICFDKTGTLTEDHLDLYGFRPNNYLKGNFTFANFCDDMSNHVRKSYKFYKEKYFDKVTTEKYHAEQLEMNFVESLVCTNCITRVNNILLGDPIDIEMFKSTGWIMEESANDSLNYSVTYQPSQELNNTTQPKYKLQLVRRFNFISKLQRMSVIIKNPEESYYKIFCKGSPEKIKQLCRIETIPSNFNRILSQYTNHGLRVLALSFKMVKMDETQVQKISRESAEHEMIFLGFFIVANKLRPRTKRTIPLLQAAGIKTIIATGDNVFTATSVAKECHVIPEDTYIYRIELSREKGVLELDYKELIMDIGDEVDSDSSSDSNELPQRKISKLITVDDVDEDDLESESDGYEENDIHLIIKAKPEVELKSLSIKKVAIKPNSCFIITGEAFEILHKLSLKIKEDTKNEEFLIYNQLFKNILDKTLVFARMLPEHKTLLIQCLKEEKFIVAMCGDGANDIGALRTANVGISLGLDDTAISAHFITSSPEIQSIVRILREGKAWLSNTIECYKFMMMFSYIQVMACVLLAKNGSYLTINQFLFTDLLIVFPNSFLIARSEPIKLLTIDLPERLCLKDLMDTLISQIFICFFFQLLGYYLLTSKDWYVKNESSISIGKPIKPSYENTTLFLISYLQIIIVIIVFSIESKFKKSVVKNKALLGYLAFDVLFGYYLILVPDNGVDEFFGLLTFDDQKFRFIIILLSIVQFFLSLYTENELLPKIRKCFKY